jgi:hypothetical protein
MPRRWERFEKVVTVTDAIFAPAPFTHWCSTENPTLDKRFAYRDRIQETRPVIWGLEKWSMRWRVNMNLRDYRKFDHLSHSMALSMLPWETKIKDWSHGPTFHALARLIGDGHQEIDLYGSDWRGGHNVHPGSGERLGRASKDPARRWNGERELFKRIKAEAAENGVQIRRHGSPLELRIGRALDDEGDSWGPPGGRNNRSHQ